MLHRILLAALVAGFVGGLATAVLQHFTTTPLIVEAELYENGEAGAVHSSLNGATYGGARLILAHTGADHGDGDHEAWAPADGIERTLYTSVATVGTAFGFALILLSAMVLTNTRISARSRSSHRSTPRTTPSPSRRRARRRSPTGPSSRRAPPRRSG